MEMQILQSKISNERRDSFWYEGEIAILGNCVLVATGDIRVEFSNDGAMYKNREAVDEARERNYTDKDINKLEFSNNNWFEVISINGDCAECDVVYDYDEAIELLEQYHIEKIYN